MKIKQKKLVAQTTTCTLAHRRSEAIALSLLFLFLGVLCRIYAGKLSLSATVLTHSNRIRQVGFFLFLDNHRRLKAEFSLSTLAYLSDRTGTAGNREIVPKVNRRRKKKSFVPAASCNAIRTLLSLLVLARFP